MRTPVWIAACVLSASTLAGCVNAQKAIGLAQSATNVYEAWSGPGGVRDKVLDIAQDVERGLMTAQQATAMLAPILPASLIEDIGSWLAKVEEGAATAQDVTENVVDPAMEQLRVKAESLLADAQAAVESQDNVDFTLRVISDALAVLFPPVAAIAGIFLHGQRKTKQTLRDVVVSLEAAKDPAAGVIKHKEAKMPARARLEVDRVLAREGL